MARRSDSGSSSRAKQRYREFARSNNAYDQKVKKSISRIEKTARRTKNGRAAES